VIYTPDWTLLDQVITKSNSVFKQKDSYQEANWTAFENELNRAKDLRKNSKAEQDAINAQSASLNQALLKLRKTPSASLIR